MIIKKRQVLILTLALVICLAVYINWRFTSSGANQNNTEINKEQKNLGEAKFVDNQNAYFAEARLNRKETRGEAQSILTAILNNDKSTAQNKADATAKLAVLAAQADTEGRIENLVKAKGYKECVAIVSDKSVSVVVQTEGLKTEDVVKIKDIAVSETKLKPGDVKIIEIK